MLWCRPMADETPSETFTGDVKVASRIIDYLSSGLYPSPAACLKELINNSYDADASLVEVFVKPDAGHIVIIDNGCGLSRAEFETHFSRISESHKRESGEKTDGGRPKIGKIGIGFIAANELCDELEIFSTKLGDPTLLHVTMNFDVMREPIDTRRDENGDIVKAEYAGEILSAQRSEHFTQIFLKRVRGEAREILAGAQPQSENRKKNSLYGLGPDSVAAQLRERSLSTWKQFDSYSETMLKVALNIPVRYNRHWVPKHLEDSVATFARASRNLRFEVKYDGADLEKPVVLDPGGNDAFIKTFAVTGKLVKAKGYLYVQHGAIRPQELQGVLLRIRGAAVGEYDSSFWGFSNTEATVIQRWVSGEIWADDRLEEAMNIDRATLREAHPAYVELRAKFHEELRRTLKEARLRLYEKRSEEKQANTIADALQTIKSLAESASHISKPAAAHLARTWSVRSDDDLKALLRKRTVAEIYEICLSVASDFVPASRLDEFIQRLTQELRKR